MFKFKADLSNFLNGYIGQEHKFGQNDCNILIADYLDTFIGTDYASKLKGQYSSVQEGLKKCFGLVGFNNVFEACENHLERSDNIEDGSVVLIKKKYKNRNYYQASIVINNKVLIENNNRYEIHPVELFDYDLIYNRSKQWQ